MTKWNLFQKVQGWFNMKRLVSAIYCINSLKKNHDFDAKLMQKII